MLLKNCRYIITQDPQRRILEHCDLEIEGNVITRIAPSIAKEGIDCSEKIVMPGLVNTHTHSGMHLLKGVCDDEQLKTWLDIVIPKEKALTDAEITAGCEMACKEMILGGTTTFADLYWPIAPIASAAKKFNMRCLLFPALQNLAQGGATLDDVERLLQEKDERVAYGVGAHSIYACDEATLQKASALAKRYGAMKLMHIAETRKERFDIQERTGKLPVEYLESIAWLDDKTLLVHAIWLTKAEIRLLKKFGVSISHCPVSNMKLASGGVMPLPEMHSEGVTVGLGTDSVASNNNLGLFEEMKVCGLLHKHHRWDARTAPLQNIVDMATIDGARALGMDKDIGSLEVGKKADIITLDLSSSRISPINNLLSAVVYAAQSADVCDVIIDGKTIVRDRTWV